MTFLSKFGELVLAVFSITGAVVVWIVRLPRNIRELDLRRTGPEKIRETVNQIDTEDVSHKISQLTQKGENYISSRQSKSSSDLDRESIDEEPIQKHVSEDLDGTIIIKNPQFESKEKENAILKLQVSAGGFLVISVLMTFNFISFILFAILGVLITAYILYMLYYQVKLMYPKDFNAYRDFFLMYVAVGIVIVIVAGNSAVTMAFPFQFFPSFSLLLFALIAVLGVFLIFRIKHHRDHTYGEVIEAGVNTSHVKVDYDIRSNVKPDIYIVENNNFHVVEHEIVKLNVEGGVFNMKGNKPTLIIGKLEKI
jgi:uncharacterized membrane protein